jgi:hypothetical protein
MIGRELGLTDFGTMVDIDDEQRPCRLCICPSPKSVDIRANENWLSWV